MARRYYSSVAVRTTLSSSISNSATSITVAAVTGFPGSFPYTLIIDEDTADQEIVEVTNSSGTTLTVTRGVDGSAAVAHDAGSAVNHGVSARDYDEPNEFLNTGGTVTGPTVVDVNSASTALRVTQTGSGAAFVVEDSANPDSTPFVVDASGNIGIGGVPSNALLVRKSISNSSTTPSITQVHLAVNNSSTTTGTGGMIGLGSADEVFSAIKARLTDSSNIPIGDLTFLTRNLNTDLFLTQRMIILATGNVGIGTSTPGYKLDVNGTVNATEVLVNGSPISGGGGSIGLEAVFMMMGA